MTARSPERIAAAAVLGCASILAASRLLAPPPPLPEAQVGGLARSYYLRYSAELDIQAVLIGLASVLGLAFLGALAAVVRRSSAQPWLARVILAAGTIALALELASAGSLGALADFRRAEVLGATPDNAGGALALFQLYSELGSLAVWPVLALVAAGSWVAWSSPALPAWFSWYGLALSAAVLLDRLVPAVSLGELARYGFLLWVAAASVLLVREPDQLAPTEEPSAPVG